MDISSLWQVILTFLLAAFPWLLPNIAVSHKVIIVLSILLVSFAFYCIRLWGKIKSLTKQNNEINNNHQALARRFEQKRIDLNRYENAINSIEYLIMCTVQTSKQDRLNVLYNGFLAIKNELLQGKVDSNE